MVGGVRDKPPTKTPVLFKFSHCGFIHSRSAITTKKCTWTKDLVDDIIRKSHPLIWNCAKKKLSWAFQNYFLCTCDKNLWNQCRLCSPFGCKTIVDLWVSILGKNSTVPISDSRKMDVVQFCYYDTVLLSFHIYLTWIIKKILALCHSVQKT